MTKTDPKVTVIVPAYNEERFIGRCMRSLLSQKFPWEDYEIIVVDDGSTDRTPYALELFREDVIRIRSDATIGLPASLNKAISRVRSPYIVRVDADDFVSRDFLNFLYTFIQQNGYMDAVSCDYNLVNDEGDVLERKNCMQEPIACGIIFRTSDIIELGMYDEEFRLHEERDLRIRFLQKYNMHRLELPLYRYRKHEGNSTNDSEAMEYHLNQLKSKHGIDD
jgi:hypothetical protein